MSYKKAPPAIPAPTGTEDKAQLRALGDHLARVARGEITPARPEDLGRNMVQQWGFTAEDRARIEQMRPQQSGVSPDKQPPRPPKP